MSAVSIRADRVPALKVTQRRVLRSELTKFRSLRSTASGLDAHLALLRGTCSHRGQRGGIRMAPSRRMVSPLTYRFSSRLTAMWA
jgi:hypothetical protein